MLHELRSPEVLGTLERLQLRTRRRLAGQLVGGHRSRRYGASLDFADFREYQPGDDFRRIDYLTLARLDQLLIRLYDAEDDLTVRLIVDTSASMQTDNKLQRAVELAGAIGFVALTRRDRVEVHAPGRQWRDSPVEVECPSCLVTSSRLRPQAPVRCRRWRPMCSVVLERQE